MRRLLLVRGEHRADRRQHVVEVAIGAREVLRISLHKGDLQTLSGSPTSGHFEQGGDVIDSDCDTEATRRSKRNVPGAGGDVQRPGAGAQVHRLNQRVGERDGDPRDLGVVAATPRNLLPRLDLLECRHSYRLLYFHVEFVCITPKLSSWGRWSNMITRRTECNPSSLQHLVKRRIS